MFETSLTVIGNIVNDPIRRRVGDQDLVKFRLASNTRRRTEDGSWETGTSLFITVNCWGKLVHGVAANLGRGDAVIAVGHVHTNEYDGIDGVRRSSLEMRATAVGPDLSRSLLRVERLISQPATAPAEPDGADVRSALSGAAELGSAALGDGECTDSEPESADPASPDEPTRLGLPVSA